jgi:lipoprotein-anchoring transpeptidase ErfK/SrfK
MRFVPRATIAVLVASGLGLSGVLVAAPAGADTSPSPSPTVVSTTAPGAPTISDIKRGLASGQLVVSYAAPASDGGSPITAYEASINSGAAWWPCTGTAGSCTLTNLSNGADYSVTLRALNAVGAGPASAAVSASPSAPAVADPDKPEKLPKPRVWTNASFNAASNNLGVDGSRTKLGVGTLPKLTFTRAITDKRAVETHLSVTAVLQDGRVKKVKGAWGWMSDRSAVFRPIKYWPGHATIMISSTLDRAVLGRSGAKYVIGSKNLATTWTFKTARKLVAKVDGQKVNMRVWINGEKVKTFPVSLGKSEWETRNGVKVISTQKEETHTYLSTSLNLGPEEEYELEAPWNTRLTPTGEFIHTATWAYGRIGRYNGSHGCTNMFESDAKWIFDKTIPGDVVVYENTGGTTVQSWNGPGGLWNIPWDQWLKKSALGSNGVVDTTDATAGSGGQEASA